MTGHNDREQMSVPRSSGPDVTRISIISIDKIMNDGYDSSVMAFLATSVEDEIIHAGNSCCSPMCLPSRSRAPSASESVCSCSDFGLVSSGEHLTRKFFNAGHSWCPSPSLTECGAAQMTDDRFFTTLWRRITVPHDVCRYIRCSIRLHDRWLGCEETHEAEQTRSAGRTGQRG